MYVLIVTIKIKPEHREAYIEASLGDSIGSVTNEPSCLRFDVHQDEKDPNTIYLIEVYRDKAAFEAHKETPHFKKWADAVKDWHAEPRQVVFCSNIFPTDADWQKDWKK